MSSLYWDTSAPYLVPSIVSMTKRDPSELIHIVFGFCDGIEFRLTMTDKEIESRSLGEVSSDDNAGIHIFACFAEDRARYLLLSALGNSCRKCIVIAKCCLDR